MRFHLELDCDNAAFRDADGGLDGAAGAEVARLLQKAAGQVDEGYLAGSLIDINGTKVGEWRFVP